MSGELANLVEAGYNLCTTIKCPEVENGRKFLQIFKKWD